MKPDGVATAAMETMGVREGAEPVCEESQSAPPPEVKKPAGEGKPPGDKTKSTKSGDAKAKAKGPTRAKAGTNALTSAKASATCPRPSPAQNRVVNGVQKQLASNGVPKKAAPPVSEKKKLAPAPAPAKKSVSPTKLAEKKPVTAGRPTSAPATAGTATPKKKAPAVASNDAKAKPKTAAPRPASAALAKSSTGAAAKPDKPAVSMATRPAAGPPGPRPAPTASAGKLASSSARPGPVKTAVPSAGKTSTTQSPKPPTSAKKDVSRPTSTVAKKSTESPGRPSAAKTSKSESPKPASASKPDTPNKRPVSSTKPADSKPTRPKPQEVKASPSPRPAGSKPGVGKSASPKKAVGSSTPMPVKRAPKPMPPVSAAGEQADENLLQKPAASLSDTVAPAAQAQVAEPNVGHAPQREEAVELPPQPADRAQEETEVPNVSTPRLEDSKDSVILEEPEVASLAQSPPSSTPASLQALNASLVAEPVTSYDDTSSKDQPPMTTAEDSVEYEPKSQPCIESIPQVSAPTDLLAMISPVGETEVAVEKADEEINVDNDEDEEYDEKDNEDGKHEKKECGIQLSDMSVPQTLENFPKSDDLELDTKDINGHQEELMKHPSGFMEEMALDNQEEVGLMGTGNESTDDTTCNSRITQHTCVMQLEKEDEQQEEEEEEQEKQWEEKEQEEKQWEEKEQEEKQQEEEEHDEEEEEEKQEEEEEKHQSEEEQEEEEQQVEEEEKEEEKHQSEEEQEEKQQQVEEEEKEEEKHQSEEEQEEEQQQVEEEEREEEKHQSEEEQEEEEEEEMQRDEQEAELSLQLPEICSSQPMEKCPAETNCSGFQDQMRMDLNLDAHSADHDDDDDDDDVKGSQQEVQHHSTFDLLEDTERTLNSAEAGFKEKECEIFDAPSHHSELMPDITVDKKRGDEEDDTEELKRRSQPIAEYLAEFANLASCTGVQGLSNPVIDATDVNDCHLGTQKLSTPDLLGALERTCNQHEAGLMETKDKLTDTLSQHNEATPQIPPMDEEETEEAQFSLQMSEMSRGWQMEEFPAKSVDLISCISSQSPLTVDLGIEDLSNSHVKALEQDIAILPEDVDSTCILSETNLKEEEQAVLCSAAHRLNFVQETPEKHEEEEDDDEEEEADQQDDMDVGSEQADDRRRVLREDEEEDEDVEMASEGVTEGGLESYENVDEDDLAEGERHLHNLNLAPSLPPVSSGPWDQLPQSAADQPLDQSLKPWASSPVLPAQPAWLDLGNTLQKEEPLLQASAKSPMNEVSRPVMPGYQPGSLGDTPQAAHGSSGSETGTPEELADYDSSSGVESRSEDKQRTPVPPAQPDIEQDLGIHLEKGDVEGEEEEAETLPADEVMGDPPTAHTSAPSSPSSSGDEASDTEGEIDINDPSSHIIVNANLDGKSGAHDHPALDESGEEDGGTPQSAASVPSYAFDCPTSNAHSTAESCGKSPGLFSLENEEQLLEDAKDPCLAQELTLSAATGHIDHLLGSPVALLPLSHNEKNDKEEEDEEEEEVDPDEEQYLLREKSEMGFPGILSTTGPLEADGLLSPHHHHTSGEDSEAQPPYFSAICDKTDNALAGNV